MARDKGFLLGLTVSIASLLVVVGAASPERASPVGRGETLVNEADAELSCAANDVETSTVITYAAGATRGQQTPRAALESYLDLGYPDASANQFIESTPSAPNASDFSLDGPSGPIALAYMQSNGEDEWRVEKFNACYKGFEQPALGRR